MPKWTRSSKPPTTSARRGPRSTPRTGHGMAELTEMAGVAEAETQAAYAWALDYDGVDEFPTQRLTSRHITALSLATSLIMIAVAGVVALTVARQLEPAPAPTPLSRRCSTALIGLTTT